MTTQPRLLTALITPFKNDSVNEEALSENIDFQLSQGVEGILVLGTTGEAPTLTAAERRTVIKTAVKAAQGRVPVWVGTGTNATQTTIERTLEAQQLGADAALVVTPYYNRPTQEGIYAHFSAICEATGLPLCLYNIPKRTGCALALDTIQRLAALPQIIGIKEASGDVNFTARVLYASKSFKSPFTVWCGDDTLTLPMMSIGVHGVISVASNLVPDEMSRLVQLAALGEGHSAQQVFLSFFPLLEALNLETNPIPIKTAMGIVGMPAGPCRLPLGEMDPEKYLQLERVLAKFKVFAPL